MFRMNFILKEKKDGSLSLVLPIWFRFLFLFIALVLAAGVFASGPESERTWIPLLIIALCTAGSLYEEKWIFNISTGKIEYINGVMLINKKIIYKMEETEIFQISGYSHLENESKLSRLRKKMIKFSLILNSGEVLNIDISTGKTESSELRKKAKRIASYCRIQLSVNSYL